MASAVLPSSTNETFNFARLCRLVVDVGSQALRDTFDAIHPPTSLHLVLTHQPVHAKLQFLKKKRVLNPTQWGKLYPNVPSSVSSADFDIVLLVVLLRNICGLVPPSTGWDSLPPPTDMSKEANIARLKYYRNTVYGHASEASVDDTQFNSYWQDISSAILGLAGAGYGVAISKLKNESMDLETKDHYTQLLKQWKQDDDNIKETDTKENYRRLPKLWRQHEGYIKETGTGVCHKQLLKEKKQFNEMFREMKEQIRQEVQQVESQMQQVESQMQQMESRMQQIKSELQDSQEKFDSSMRNREQSRQESQQMKSKIQYLEEKFDSLMVDDTRNGERTRVNPERLESEIGILKEKLKTVQSQPSTKKKLWVEDSTEIVDGIRQLYKVREGWLAPFSWCEDFGFSIDDIYTELKVISSKKTVGTVTYRVVRMSEMFNPHEGCEEPRVVLVEGKPGVGKTTFCHKVVFDWATQKRAAKNCFGKFFTILLIKCCEVQSGLWEAIDDQLLPRDVVDYQKKRFFDFIRHNQSKVLLVLDGLDEVSEIKVPMFSEIIQGRVLPKCRVIVTARHEVGVKVRRYCNMLLEVKGFTDEDARRFITKFFQTEKALANRLLVQLHDDRNLQDLAASPLNCTVLCLVLKDFNGRFPQSRSKLYMVMVECILRRYRAKKQLSETREDLVQIYESQLRHLGSIALKGLLEDNLDFDEEELEKHKARDLPGLGFLSFQPGSSKLRPTRRYGFLHRTFQEFFAALNLGCQIIKKEISTDSVAADERYRHQLKEVLPFTFGILAARYEETAENLVRSMATQLNEEEEEHVAGGLAFAFKGINECKNDNSCDEKLARALGACLQIEVIDLSGTRIDKAFAVLLANVLKTGRAVKILKLSGSNAGDYLTATVVEGLKRNASLAQLNLSHNKIGDAGAAALADCLKNNISLAKLDLPNNEIAVAGAAALAECLLTNTSLTELDLGGNNIVDAGAAALSECLKGNKSLTELSLSGNYIGDAGAAALAESLKCNKSLIKLDLSRNEIGGDGFAALAECLTGNMTLTALNVSHNGIGYAGVSALTKHLDDFMSAIGGDVF
ncbi:nucleotide-binding oligomerization domain-containing protein 2-like isoform X2 [Stylophora pistillata]|uniref:nucleotide-binding oligomerization domain-containing protein 2-like isoform X2 n=1 Tax=Stylophora pistillata TaxID=50429 RepID=UPI000C04A7FA|nr:nucleotide-binding oligomerization domain-containing protein 2-like isoform X2 [Stylophora pistillata]